MGKGKRNGMRSFIREKLERLRDGSGPRVLDLFSGCGGLFLGFHRAGSVSVGGVEVDPFAARSFATNFHHDLEKKAFEAHATPVDITKVGPREFLLKRGHDDVQMAVDVVVGGPPCPSFARVGRAKLREIHRHPEAFRHDPRGRLYLPYLEYVKALAPVALVMENVPDIMNYGGHNLGEEICESLEDLGYRCAYSLLNSANYGVPQMRERFILFAFHEEANCDPRFPVPTCHVEFPPGYEGTRHVALKHLKGEDGEGGDATGERSSHFAPIPEAAEGAPGPVTAAEALRDLPPITGHLEGRDRRGARRFTTAVGYRHDLQPSAYALQMRKWPSFESAGSVVDHVTRCLSQRDYRLFRRLKAGDDYPKAYALARKLFEEALRRAARNERIGKGSAAYRAMEASFVPPYDPGKFPNKWRKMEPDLPARTLMAHLGKDTYSHIHYDSAQARVISVREAARLQSFPDGFAFSGTMNPAFRQIGNSVPPLFSFALAKTLLGSLGIPLLERRPTELSASAEAPVLEEPVVETINRATG
jgi:DNA (cytosine-5)-methyltransferase 1